MPSAKNLNARHFRNPIRRPKQFLAEKSTSSNTSALGDPDPDFLRGILCGLIEQAFKDLKNESTYQSYNKTMEVAEARQTAKAFFHSRFFRELCMVLNLPADKILRRSLV
jgi:hypothetical protein